MSPQWGSILGKAVSAAAEHVDSEGSGSVWMWAAVVGGGLSKILASPHPGRSVNDKVLLLPVRKGHCSLLSSL